MPAASRLTVEIGELDRDLKRFRLGDAKRASALAGAIRLGGVDAMAPVQVMRVAIASQGGQEKRERMLVVDGFKRIEAARRAGLERVPIAVIDGADRAEALALMAQLNRETGGLSALEQGWIVHELRHAHGWTLQRIAASLGRDASWACRREQLVSRLSPEVQTLLRDGGGGLDPAAAEEIAVLPRGKQVVLARRAVRTHPPLSVAELRALVRLLREAPDEAHRRYILDHPREVLGLLGNRTEGRRHDGADPWSDLEAKIRLLLQDMQMRSGEDRGSSPQPPIDAVQAGRLKGLLSKLIALLEEACHERKQPPTAAALDDARAGRADSGSGPRAEALDP